MPMSKEPVTMNQTLDIRALLPLQFLCRELSSTGGGAVERLAERRVWGLRGPRESRMGRGRRPTIGRTRSQSYGLGSSRHIDSSLIEKMRPEPAMAIRSAAIRRPPSHDSARWPALGPRALSEALQRLRRNAVRLSAIEQLSSPQLGRVNSATARRAPHHGA